MTNDTNFILIWSCWNIGQPACMPISFRISSIRCRDILQLLVLSLTFPYNIMVDYPSPVEIVEEGKVSFASIRSDKISVISFHLSQYFLTAYFSWRFMHLVSLIIIYANKQTKIHFACMILASWYCLTGLSKYYIHNLWHNTVLDQHHNWSCVTEGSIIVPHLTAAHAFMGAMFINALDSSTSRSSKKTLCQVGWCDRTSKLFCPITSSMFISFQHSHKITVSTMWKGIFIATWKYVCIYNNIHRYFKMITKFIYDLLFY